MQAFHQQGNNSLNPASKIRINARSDDTSPHLKSFPIVKVTNSNEQLFAAFENPVINETETLSDHCFLSGQPKSDAAFWLEFRNNLDSNCFYQYFMQFIENDIDVDIDLLREVKKIHSCLRNDKIEHTKSYIEVLFQASIKLKKLRIITCALEHINFENQQATSLFDSITIKRKKNENYTMCCNFLIKSYSDTYKDYLVNRNAELQTFTSEKLAALRKKIRNKMISVEKMTRLIKIDQAILQEKNKEVMNLINKIYEKVSSETQVKMDISLKKYIAKEEAETQAQVVSNLLMELLTEQASLFCDEHKIDSFDYPVSNKFSYADLFTSAYRAKAEILRIKVNILQLMIEEKKEPCLLAEQKARKNSILAIRKTHLKMLFTFVKHGIKHQKYTQELRTEKVVESSSTLGSETIIAYDDSDRDKIRIAQKLCKKEMDSYQNALSEHPEFTDEMLKSRLVEYLQDNSQIKAFRRMIVECLADEAIQNTSQPSFVESKFSEVELVPSSGAILDEMGYRSHGEQKNISSNSLSTVPFPSPEKINILRNLLSQPFTNEAEDTLLKCRALLAYYESNKAEANFTFRDNQGKIVRKQQIEYWSYCFLHGDLPLLRGSYEFNNQEGFHAEHLFNIYSTLVNNPYITIAQLSFESRKSEQALFKLLSRIGFIYNMDANTGLYSWKLMDSIQQSIPIQSTSQVRITNSSEIISPNSLFASRHPNKNASDLEPDEYQPARKKIKRPELQSRESLKALEIEDLDPNDFDLLDFLNQDLAKDHFEYDLIEEFGIDNEFSDSFFANLGEMTPSNQHLRTSKSIVFEAVNSNYEQGKDIELPNVAFE